MKTKAVDVQEAMGCKSHNKLTTDSLTWVYDTIEVKKA
jgi:hypothetical protein